MMHWTKLLLLLLFTVIVQAQSEKLSDVCLAKRAPGYDKLKNGKLANLTSELLTKYQFGLVSFVYPLSPENGYPLTFGIDGIVYASQFHGSKWRLSDGAVLLVNQQKGIFKTFRYDSRCHSLRSELTTGDQTISMELFIVEPRP